MKLGKAVLKPIVTEKTYALASEGKYVFKVTMLATKGSICEELKRLYDVEPVSISTTIMPGKSKRIMKSRLTSKPKKWKKAIVQLKKGQTIDLFPKE
ncbi:MAG: 50S ribosomal protein L23 [Patescibacteria group bacterium]|nr:50S ribosomal protein L23 [Patescibacteria group bacterium]MBU1953074.1 50S ribosomal protein L23 [Patescibacteria group bacterium]